jgi:hypothetical protein
MANGFKSGGRTKGTENNITKEVKETLTDFINSEIQEVTNRIDELSISERANLLVKLLPYTIPKIVDKSNQAYEDITVTNPIQPLEFRVIGKDGQPI